MTLRCYFFKVIKNNLNPCWRKFSVPLQTFCGGDFNKPIKVGFRSLQKLSLFVAIGNPASVDVNYELLGGLVVFKFLDCLSRLAEGQLRDCMSVKCEVCLKPL